MFTDPNDHKTATAQELIAKYSTSYAMKFLAMLIDELDAYRDRPTVDVKVVGDMTGSVKVAHGLKDAAGKAVKPACWHIVGFSGADTVQITAVDETNITVKINNKGEATFRLSL